MNADELVKAVRHSGLISEYDPEWTDEQILIEADQVLIETFAEVFSKLRAGHWKHTKLVPLVSGQDFYQLPPRALAQGLQSVEISQNNQSWSNLLVLTDAQFTDYDRGSTGIPGAYVLEMDGLRLTPVPSSSGTIRMTYLLRPPQLISPSEVSTLPVLTVTPTSIIFPYNENLREAFPDPAATYPRGQGPSYDFQRVAGSHEMSLVDAQAKDVTLMPGGTQLEVTFYDVEINRVIPGDIAVSPGIAIYPTLPAELHRALADATAAAIWRSKGDYEKAQQLTQRADAAIKRVVNMSTPRVKNAPFVWWNKNSYLRRNIGGW